MAATISHGAQQPIPTTEQRHINFTPPTSGYPLKDILEVPGVFEFVREHNRSCGHGFNWQEEKQTITVRCCRCEQELVEVRKPLHDKGRLANDGPEC